MACLQKSFQRLLGGFCHIIDFVQYDEFRPHFEYVFGLDELVDLGTNDIDPPLIGSIQMNDRLLVFARMSTLIFVD